MSDEERPRETVPSGSDPDLDTVAGEGMPGADLEDSAEPIPRERLPEAISLEDLPDSDSRHYLAPGTRVDAYKVQRLLGQGGMGEVYLARDTRLGRKVALKLVHPSRVGDDEATRRFLFEARTTARFSHPHIVTVYGVGEHEGRPFVALEYLEGQSLLDRCQQDPPSTREAMRIGLAIAEALTEAHRHGVLHRDLKPGNVLIPRDGRLRVVDFGLAKRLQPAAGGTGEFSVDEFSLDEDSLVALDSGERFAPLETGDRKIFGTPIYMAPEQWEGRDVTQATDVWALGVILYELLAGHRPYPDVEHTPMTLLLKVTSDEPVPLPDAFAEIPSGLRELVLECLEKDPADRPSALAVRDALEGMLFKGRERRVARESPFRGLAPFGERHADLFFGREAEIAAFLERVRTDPVLPVVGPSGAGKSSFVQAGVIPRLRESAAWLVLAVRPGAEPFTTLAGRLLSGHSSARWRASAGGYVSATAEGGPGTRRGRVAAESLISTQPVERPSGDSGSGELPSLDTGEISLPSRPSDSDSLRGEEALAAQLLASPERLGLELQALAERERCRVLLFVDQLEELYTLGDDEEVQRRYMEAVCAAADDPLGPVRVVFTLRDDFLGRVAVGRGVRETLGRVTVIRAPGPDALHEILTRPLEAADYRYDDPALVDEMVAAVRGEPGALPLLQFAARTLWDRRDRERRMLLRRVHEEVGGVAGALAEHAQGVLEGLSAAQVALAREILLRLVTPEGTRRVVSTADAVQGLGGDGRQVLGRLTRSRLVAVRKGRETTSKASWSDGVLPDEAELELVHESLIRNWAQLRSWLDESREERSFVAELEQAAALWDQRGRRAEEVWLGDALHEALRRLERTAAVVPEGVGAFLEAGRRREQAMQQRRRLGLASAFVITALVAVISIAIALTLGEKEHEAQVQRAAAEARHAEAQLEGARAALMRGELLEARAKLRGALETEDSPMARALWWSLSRDPLLWRKRLGSTVNDVAFSPDGRVVAAACEDKSIYLYEVQTQNVRILRGHQDQIFSIDISPDGERLASGSWSGRIWLWDLQTGEHRILEGHGHAASVDFGPDAGTLASASVDGSVLLWDLREGAQATVIEAQGGPVYGVALDPAGERLATAGRDGNVRIWDLARGGPPQVLSDSSATMICVAFHPDGHLLASGSSDATVRLYDLDGGAEPVVLRGHGGAVYGVSFRADGRTLATGSFDRSARIWDVERGELQRVLHTAGGGVFALEYSPDGALLATGDADQHLEIWNLAAETGERTEVGHEGRVVGLAFGDEGRVLASGGAEGQLRLWDVATGEELQVIDSSDEALSAVGVAPDGSALVGAGWDETIRIWDRETGALIGEIEAVRAGVHDLRFSPDGDLMAVGSQGGQLLLIDTADWSVRRRIEGLESVKALGFSPDGRRLVVSGRGPDFEIFDVATGRRLRTLSGHTSSVWGVAFDPSGERIASAGEDGSVRLWDLATGRERRIGDVDGRVYYLSFHPDGTRLATAQSDGSARIWNLDQGGWIALRGHRSEVNRVRFSPDGTRLATASDDGTVRVWDAATGQPFWRVRAMLSEPPEILTHRGWVRLDGEPAADRGEAWRAAVEARARFATESDDDRHLCVWTEDGAVELWDRAEDRLLRRVSDEGTRQVVATGEGCATLAEGQVQLHTWAGEVRTVHDAARTVAWDGTRLHVRTGSQLACFDGAGEAERDLEIGVGVTASACAGEWLVLGFTDGNLELYPLDGDRERPTFSFEDVPSSPVVRILEGPADTLIVGFADGMLGLWDRRDGKRLDHSRLHGPVSHLLLREQHLYAATELGDHAVLDLEAFYADRCALLRQVWDEVPVVWEQGLPVERAPAADHECAAP